MKKAISKATAIEQEKSTSLTIRPSKGKIDIDYTFGVFYNKVGDLYSCYVIFFDFYYTSKSEEDVMNDGRTLVQAYLDLWHSEGGLANIIFQIENRGFRSSNHLLLRKNVMEKKPIKASKLMPRQGLAKIPINMADSAALYSSSHSSLMVH